jgi:hypothetical protein
LGDGQRAIEILVPGGDGSGGILQPAQQAQASLPIPTVAVKRITQDFELFLQFIDGANLHRPNFQNPAAGAIELNAGIEKQICRWLADRSRRKIVTTATLSHFPGNAGHAFFSERADDRHNPLFGFGGAGLCSDPIYPKTYTSGF